jgi:hypothetical protein
MLTKILFNTDKISDESIKRLKNELAFELDVSDIELTRWGDGIEIGDYLNVKQVKTFFEMIKPKMRAIDEIQVNSRE